MKGNILYFVAFFVNPNFLQKGYKMTKPALTLVKEPLPVVLPDFDLSFVTEQLSSYPEYADWDESRFAEAEMEYRRFLALCRSYPDRLIGLSIDADHIWHQHVLNTRRYVDDCNNYFGAYFHHSPVVDEVDHLESQRQTEALYLEVFGEPRVLHVTATCTGGCMCN